LREGATDFLGPPVGAGAGPRPRAEPFYNPAMALDRDLGVAFARAVDPPLARGWEMTAATGVRGLRLLREGAGFVAFVFSESSPRSFAVLERNLAAEPRATAILSDGRAAPPTAPFDYVDVDPYGSPLPFLPTALDAVRTGGVLAVTATDMLVLAGPQAAACRRRYGAEPVRGRLGPEGALRVLLMVLAREVRSSGRSIRPLLAYVGDHHVRAYVRILARDGAEDPVTTIDPDRWDGPSLGTSTPVGPMWLGPLVDPELAALLAVPETAARPRELRRFLELLKDDAAVPRPFYYEANLLASRLGLASPPSLDALLARLREAGYRAGRTHARPEGVRTDAPRSVVETAARELGGADQSQNARVRA
jgi:tRNA (guanine26-N2/guanine27-N2)-dimethyltransferase